MPAGFLQKESIVDNNFVNWAVTSAASVAGVDPDVLVSPLRKWPLPMVRAMAYEYIYDMGFSYPQVGRIFGRSHSTIMLDKTRLNDLKEYDKEVRRMYRQFNERVHECELDSWL